MATLSGGHGGARVVAAAHSGVQRRQGPAAARQREGGGERETVEERERPAVEETAEHSRLRRSVSRSDRLPVCLGWVAFKFQLSFGFGSRSISVHLGQDPFLFSSTFRSVGSGLDIS
ncbi:hypothetical protein Hanom_Chr09g00827211 [Helianthus anomalus]